MQAAIMPTIIRELPLPIAHLVVESSLRSGPSVILPVHWKVKGELAVKIGELAKQAGTTTKTIRFYEDEGLLPPPARTPGGYRDYSTETVDRLRFIQRGQATGLSLREVRKVLTIRDGGNPPCAHVRNLLHERLNQVRGQIAELVALEGHLATLLDKADRGPSTQHDESSVCWILESDEASQLRVT